jgi:hypothetical protein
MEAPRTDQEALLDLWRQEGISSLDRAAGWTINRLRAEDEPMSLPIDVDALFDETPLEIARTIKHGTLRYPVEIEGEEVDDLTPYNGIPLHYVVDSRSMAGGPIRALTSVRALAETVRDLLTNRPERELLQRRENSRRDDGLIGYSDWAHFSDAAVVFEHAGYGGDVKWFTPPQRQWSDLTRVRRGWFGDWNDVISSLGNSRSLRVFSEHINGQGSSLTLSPGWEAFNLVHVADGWNDRISTITNFG